VDEITYCVTEKKNCVSKSCFLDKRKRDLLILTCLLLFSSSFSCSFHFPVMISKLCKKKKNRNQTADSLINKTLEVDTLCEIDSFIKFPEQFEIFLSIKIKIIIIIVIVIKGKCVSLPETFHFSVFFFLFCFFMVILNNY
jgi:hypothetical protein